MDRKRESRTCKCGMKVEYATGVPIPDDPKCYRCQPKDLSKDDRIAQLEQDLQDALAVILLTKGADVMVSNNGRELGRLKRIIMPYVVDPGSRTIHMVISEEI